MTRDPHWKRKLLIGRALFFPLPPLGWVMALGFRGNIGLILWIISLVVSALAVLLGPFMPWGLFQ